MRLKYICSECESDLIVISDIGSESIEPTIIYACDNCRTSKTVITEERIIKIDMPSPETKTYSDTSGSEGYNPMLK